MIRHSQLKVLRIDPVMHTFKMHNMQLCADALKMFMMQGPRVTARRGVSRRQVRSMAGVPLSLSRGCDCWGSSGGAFEEVPWMSSSLHTYEETSLGF